jgi:hypothetical protein
MLRKTKRSHAKRNIIFVVVAFVVVASGVLMFGRLNHWWDGKNASVTTKDDPAHPKTRPATSEGKKFDVPANLPKDSIKDYILVTEDERFKIRRSPGTDDYIITLYAIINRPDQYKMYKDQLHEYKQAALDYLKSINVDVNKAHITYEPQEATNL